MPRFSEEDIQAFSDIIEDCYERAEDPSIHSESQQNQLRHAAHRSEQLWADQLDRPL